MRVGDIEQRAYEVFGDRAKAQRWLSTPKTQLGGRTPAATAARSAAGAAAVAEMLERIDSGFFA